MNKKFVIGDIHGECDKLIEALKAVDFDYDNDVLISLGDIVDRGPKSFECIEELLKIKNLIPIRGNHDQTWFESLRSGDFIGNLLYNQGGRETYQSYLNNTAVEDEDVTVNKLIKHIDFFKNQINYYVDEDNNCFVHGGFDRHHILVGQAENVYYWDRDLFLAALSYESMKDHTYPFKMKDGFKRVFVGHTPTTYWGISTPIKAANIWNIDTGCGKGGLLTIMNIDTEEYLQF